MKRKGFPLRLRPEVHAAIRRWANDDLRSMNAQIEFLLMQILRQAGRLPVERGSEDELPDEPTGADRGESS
jgi:hypothetical protein